MNWLMRQIVRFADWWSREKYTIGRVGLGPYLTRWTVFGKRLGRPGSRCVFLHRFHRGDPEQLHDHPWMFVSVILCGGYYEVVPADVNNPAGPTVKTWYPPGSVLFRSARWIHRVELPEGKEAVTLILRGRKVRTWFFYCPKGAVHYKQFFANVAKNSDHPCGVE